jgi:glutamate-1-semialdehyde 2,1-aminomutase
MAACKATMGELEKPGVYDRLAMLTKRLTEGITEIGKRKKILLFCAGVGSIWQLGFGINEKLKDFRDGFRVDKVTYQKFRAGCLERGIRFHPSRGRFYTSTAHTEEDIERTLYVVDDVLGKIFSQ